MDAVENVPIASFYAGTPSPIGEPAPLYEFARINCRRAREYPADDGPHGTYALRCSLPCFLRLPENSFSRGQSRLRRLAASSSSRCTSGPSKRLRFTLLSSAVNCIHPG